MSDSAAENPQSDASSQDLPENQTMPTSEHPADQGPATAAPSTTAPQGTNVPGSGANLASTANPNSAAAQSQSPTAPTTNEPSTSNAEPSSSSGGTRSITAPTNTSSTPSAAPPMSSTIAKVKKRGRKKLKVLSNFPRPGEENYKGPPLPSAGGAAGGAVGP